MESYGGLPCLFDFICATRDCENTVDFKSAAGCSSSLERGVCVHHALKFDPYTLADNPWPQTPNTKHRTPNTKEHKPYTGASAEEQAVRDESRP